MQVSIIFLHYVLLIPFEGIDMVFGSNRVKDNNHMGILKFRWEKKKIEKRMKHGMTWQRSNKLIVKMIDYNCE